MIYESSGNQEVERNGPNIERGVEVERVERRPTEQLENLVRVSG